MTQIERLAPGREVMARPCPLLVPIVEEGRSDDTEEVVRKRLEVYERQTAPVVDYYARKGVLSRVLGVGSVDEVFQRIRGVLQIRAT